MSWLPRKKVVVPIDFSDASFKAAQVALSFVDEPTDLHALHVVQPVELTHPDLFVDQSANDLRSQKTMELLRSHLSGFEFEGVTIDVRVGDPGSTIAEFAEEIDADLVVMPSHGRTGLSRIVLGSVAERVVRFSHCPVLVLRG